MIFYLKPCAIIFLSLKIDPEGSTILVGFNDGVLRSLKLVYKGNTPSHKEAPYELVLYEVHKPHTKAITSIAIDSKNEIIATGVRNELIITIIK